MSNSRSHAGVPVFFFTAFYKSRRTRPLNHLIQGPCFQLLAVKAACGSWKTKPLRFAVGCVSESCGMDGMGYPPQKSCIEHDFVAALLKDS